LSKNSGPLTYAKSGVDLDADSRRTERIIQEVSKTHLGTMVDNLPGGFAGGIKLPEGNQTLVACTDGVGTKTLLHSYFGTFQFAGVDVVANNINDLIVTGATPVAFLDYIAMSGLSEDSVVEIVKGVSDACISDGLALISGETAEMPGIYTSGHFDLAGTAIGLVSELDKFQIREIGAGDVLLGLPSGGLMTNGFSLARAAIGINGEELHDIDLLQNRPSTLEGESVGDVLTRPHPSFWSVFKQIKNAGISIKGAAHITGGGIGGNLSRVIPDGYVAVVDVTSWRRDQIFEYIQAQGEIELEEMFKAFNMGIGMIVVLSEKDSKFALASVPEFVELGKIEQSDQSQKVVLSGMEL
jgi:phosphoribosylformylglycinamidine cyclo-ligase